ncbi:hypothetical protein OPW36_06890 [Vibrio europaeus]|uniref:protein YgfX n=1 Tax=Vibrio europaeus TaxID=300876 RepID=UPI00233E7EAE|nr:protein YgfX [Vibrio europaeus]MDC5807757.1 hypothetical protein [Vibrio europaeus]MDC5824443.1 hypothetical protein [Vibrio europaeus]MDC5828065.1 hypothetical protein [Vibrio europaeus]MDC5836192.1 hypothetical protein [Vibrio europaeus]
MRLWWIRLSRTTSVKCARFYLSPSYTATMTSILVMMLVFLIVVLSSIPLVASLALIAMLVKSALVGDVLLPSMQGEVEFTSSSTYKTAQGNERIRSVNFIGMALGLLITRQDKTRFILWRDSMPEEDYRHLVVILKREH